MKTSRILALAGAVAALASCSNGSPTQWGSAPTQWDHPRMSAQEQQADRNECRSRANFQVEREELRESPFLAEQRNDQLQRMFDRYDQAARQRQLYDNCLRDKGYVPVVSEGR